MVPADAGNSQAFILQGFSNHRPAGASPRQAGALFRPGPGDETNLRCDETKFRTRENRLKRTLGITWLTKRRGRQGPWQGTVMIKALSAIAIAAFVAAALTVLPGFAPQVEASVPAPLAKADRLDVRSGGCAQQSWPNIEASCLRVPGSKMLVREARLVTAERR
jgi:hypothetical protein